MNRVLILLWFALGLSTLSTAEEKATSSIAQVITAQLTALLNEDATGAWQYAHVSIKEKFGNADVFLSMVKQAYTPMMSFTQLEFLSLTAMQDSWLQKVRLIDRRGDRYELNYILVESQVGNFEIAGVTIEANNGI